MHVQSVNKSKNLNLKLIYITIFLTNITQSPQLIGSRINSLITLGTWGVLFLNGLILSEYRIKRGALKVAGCTVLVYIYCYLMEFFSTKGYADIHLLYPVALSTFVFIVGSFYTKTLKDEQCFQGIYKTYIISTLIVSFFVFENIMSNGFEWGSRVYAYASKNSISQIFLTAIIFLFFISKKKLLLRLGIASWLILLMAMMRSRASLIGLVLVVFAIITNKSIRKIYKFLIILGVLLFAIYTNRNPTLNEIIVQGIIYGGRSMTDLNDASSGRLDMLVSFINLFPDNCILGIGNYFLESFYLSSLLQFGSLGVIPFIALLIFPLTVYKKMQEGRERIIFGLIIACYYVNGIFEELAPFGPGVKCYMLWFILGLFI